MNPLLIDTTKITPKIAFEPEKRTFEIIGESRPENVKEFYEPVLQWLDQFSTETNSQKINYSDNPLLFNFKLDYFNSSSSKFIFDIIKKIVEMHSNGISVKIIWFYEDGDDDMHDAGTELSRMVKFEFGFVVVD